MNSETNDNDHLPAGERFIDAALSEHARLGRDGFDTELVHRILLETVNRPSLRTISPVKTTTDWRMWMSGSAAVAAVLALAVVVLSSLPSGRQERPTEELTFVLRQLTQVVVPAETAKADPPMLSANRYTGALDLVSSVPSGATVNAPPSFADGNFELITTMGPAFDAMPRPGTRQENLLITADQSQDSSGRRIYEGNVIVEHHLFHLEASDVSVSTSGNTRDRDAAPLLANHVRITQKSPFRVASAKSLRFDPVSGSLTLSGVELLETAEGTLRQFPDGAELVLTDAGFTVESPRVMKYASPQLVVPQG